MIYVIVFILSSLLASLLLAKVISNADKADEAYFNDIKRTEVNYAKAN